MARSARASIDSESATFAITSLVMPELRCLHVSAITAPRGRRNHYLAGPDQFVLPGKRPTGSSVKQRAVEKNTCITTVSKQPHIAREVWS